MSEFVDCRTCKTDCVRADRNYGYTFCDKHTHPPITNGDRIRAMSDEELAKILGDKCICPPTSECEKLCGDCDVCWMEWLRHPAEKPEEDGNPVPTKLLEVAGHD